MIKVLVVDDSALMRKIISDILNAEKDMEVVGIAQNGEIAIGKIGRLNPDVITMDVDMPVMDGFTTLKKIMGSTPLPVIMLSGLTQSGAELTFKCLEAGALDYISKPRGRTSRDMEEVAAEIVYKVRKIYEETRGRDIMRLVRKIVRPPVEKPSVRLGVKSGKVIAIGISTGGPAALSKIMPEFPVDIPPVLIVQHMPKEFTPSFSERLNQCSKIRVKEAENGDVLTQGTAYVAPGNQHLELQKLGDTVKVKLSSGDKVDGHRPSATVLFKSAARVYKKNAIGVIMTGMGRDGVNGLKDIKKMGGHTIGQDQKSCIVYGMPFIAMKERCVDIQVPLDHIVPKMISLL